MDHTTNLAGGARIGSGGGRRLRWTRDGRRVTRATATDYLPAYESAIHCWGLGAHEPWGMWRTQATRALPLHSQTAAARARAAAV